MSFWGDPAAPGLLRRFVREYRHLRRDQAPNAPVVARMTRRTAAPLAWERALRWPGTQE